MEAFNLWLEHWEPLWLFLVLFAEMCIGAATLIILIKEWYYDKEIEERKYKRRLQKAKQRWENE